MRHQHPFRRLSNRNPVGHLERNWCLHNCLGVGLALGFFLATLLFSALSPLCSLECQSAADAVIGPVGHLPTWV